MTELLVGLCPDIDNVLPGICDESICKVENRHDQDNLVRHFLAFVKQLFGEMGERNAEMLALRYGLHDGVPRSYQWLGLRFMITPERVRQINCKVQQYLRSGADRWKRGVYL